MNQPKVSKSSIFAILAGVIVVLLVCMAGSLFEDADKSKNYVCQMPMSGKYVVWTDGGLQWQGFGNKHEYFKTVVVRDSVTNEITGEKELRAKAQIVADANSPSGYKRQETSPFSQYGITCGLVSILDIKYDGATQSQIDAQKQANLAVITSKTKSLEAIQRTVQITEEGRAAAERAKWEQEKEKAVAVTKAQQEFEVAELEAKKAKQVALKVQAEGEAKAAANRALVSAGLTPAERAEWDYKTAVGVAQALAESKVSWVPSVMFGGGSSSNSAMDAVGLKMLLDITKSLEKTSK